MDDRRFDALVRGLAGGASRRRVLGALVGGLLAGAGQRADAKPCRKPGHWCTADSQCCNGTCNEPGICQCDPGEELCLRDKGAPRCLTPCPDGQVFDGKCSCVCAEDGSPPAEDGTCPCPPGQERCFGVCVDILSDPDNCGGCVNFCGLNQLCTGGVCSCPTSFCGDLCLEAGAVCCDDSGGSGFCPAPFACCGGGCVDLQSSPDDCGTCGNACGGGQTCVEGACRCTAPGETICGNFCCPAVAPYCVSCPDGGRCSRVPGATCCGAGTCPPEGTCCGGTNCCTPPFECCGGTCKSCGGGLVLDPMTCACV
jgi:hypothetical protein